jgi:integrase
MKIHLKEKKNKGSISYYIEYYKGYKKVNGKIKHLREFEFLGISKIENPKNEIERKYNKEQSKLANVELKKREIDFIEGNNNNVNISKQNINSVEYYEKIMLQRANKGNSINFWKSVLNHIVSYCNPDNTTFKDVTSDFIEGFKTYLQNYETKGGKELKQNTLNIYFAIFKSVLFDAFKQGIIKDTIYNNIKSFKKEQTQRNYLTYEEIIKLQNTECNKPIVKRAFVFACYTGLRVSDIEGLKWNDIQKEKNTYFVVLRMKKTNDIIKIPLHKTALELLGKIQSSNDKVFAGFKYNWLINNSILKWKSDAGIKKHITFHSSRHTFATLHLTSGTDLYAIKNYLGHKNIIHTQIYTKLIDSKSIEGINNLPELKLN